MTKRSIVITLLISLIAGMLGAQLAVDRALKAYPGPSYGALASAGKIVRKNVQLTDAQKVQLMTLEGTYSPRMVALRHQVADATVALATALRAEPGQKEAVLASMALENAISALQDECLQYLQQVRGLLTPSQRIVLDTEIQKLLLNAARTT